ncbi:MULTISPECIES: LysR family transcriptional regulator [unclassified Sphingomonas]|uniref:LysR family transcriptional regulator n=1 Tax=unclassified Sphingomonas TaxID=196159 RepID=UPI0006FB56E6|nr:MULTISPECIES: LysR family transcriptional regulator [unclassified Sphingomonas]KQX18537.1 LysR family transcriptional regulator [Sphingomonas sp. Root1294]KQY72139.1 LysR family transcriptional regulator [Sphingomonas sp. Root50]KRB94589.1 LysR family transcriptional regulator [Sphingomonas sp. Root720]
MQPWPAIMQPMHWDDLQFFLSLARTGLLTNAARQLDVDATTVGRRIRRLETSLGGQTLFVQGREGHVLTDAGRRLLGRVETIEREADAIAAGGDQAIGEDVRGRLRVSASEGFGTWLVAHHLGEFATAHPLLTIDLAANSGFLDPSRREADVAILLARPQRGPLITKKLTDYRLRLYAATGYLEQHPPIATRADLSAHRMIGYIPDLLYSPELNYLDELGPAIDARLRSSSINAQYRMIAAGAGIGVLPCFIGDRDQSLVQVLPDLAITRSFWLVTHQDSRHLPRNALFVEWLSSLVHHQRARLLGEGP